MIDLERLIRRFAAKYVAGKPDECWEWTAGCNRRGYGKFSIGKRTFGAHRIAYFLAKGDIPDDLLVRHTCDNPPCVNPAHLVLGTQAQNIADMDARGRRPIGKLTPKQIADIRRRYTHGEKQVHLAVEYGVTQAAISWQCHRDRTS